jgi:hypothetical protein
MSKPTDVTIHWKALEKHFLMVPLVFKFNHFRGKINFLNFSQKTSVLKEFQMIYQNSSPALFYGWIG